jgi:hypothetical protein
MSFYSCIFCLDLGKTTSFRSVQELKALITKEGGVVQTALTSKVELLILGSLLTVEGQLSYLF